MTTTTPASPSIYAWVWESTRAADPAGRMQQLEWNLETHDLVRAAFGLQRDERALRRVAEVYRVPQWVSGGTLGVIDALFLYDMVQCVRPDRVIELGAAAGCSTAMLLAALADSGVSSTDQAGCPTLHSFDVMKHCYFDASREIGAAVQEMAPGLAGGLTMHVGASAVEAAEVFREKPVSLAFIDADHRHPCPVADLLLLLPVLRRGAWVILHDILLPVIAREYEERTGEKVDWADRGAMMLYEFWPWRKIKGTKGGRNIGAIQLPHDRDVTRDDLLPLIDEPWETHPAKTAFTALRG